MTDVNEMPAFSAVIFDFDGLILDTEMPAFQSWQEIFEHHGHALPMSVWELVLGGRSSAPIVCDYLEELVGPIDRELLVERRKARNLQLLEAEEILPGVRERIAEAKALGMRLGVASSSSREWVAGHLERFGLRDFFDCLRCGDEVSRVKPEPDLYLAALEGLGVEADRAIAFEDSPKGVTAAKSAGIFCVAVPNTLTSRLPLDHADLVLPSLEAVSLADLSRHVERERRAAVAD
jgi:HAD superfamily hydrolase (TIGR01509 family)